MATNIIFEDGSQLDLVCTHPTTPASGGPVRIGVLTGVALGAERADGKTTVKLNGVADLSVKGVDGNGDAAVVVGDVLYYDDDDAFLSKKDSGNTRFGVALEAVTSGATATIRVRIGY